MPGIDTKMRERRWTVGQIAEMADAELPTLRDWFFERKVAQHGDEHEYRSWRKLDFVGLLHVALVVRLHDCGVASDEASKIVARFVDDDARRATYEAETDRADKAGAKLRHMRLIVATGRDRKVRAKATLTAWRDGKLGEHTHRLSDRIDEKVEAHRVIPVGPIVDDLCDRIARAAMEHSQGRG